MAEENGDFVGRDAASGSRLGSPAVVSRRPPASAHDGAAPVASSRRLAEEASDGRWADDGEVAPAPPARSAKPTRSVRTAARSRDGRGSGEAPAPPVPATAASRGGRAVSAPSSPTKGAPQARAKAKAAALRARAPAASKPGSGPGGAWPRGASAASKAHAAPVGRGGAPVGRGIAAGRGPGAARAAGRMAPAATVSSSRFAAKESDDRWRDEAPAASTASGDEDSGDWEGDERHSVASSTLSEAIGRFEREAQRLGGDVARAERGLAARGAQDVWQITNSRSPPRQRPRSPGFFEGMVEAGEARLRGDEELDDGDDIVGRATSDLQPKTAAFITEAKRVLNRWLRDDGGRGPIENRTPQRHVVDRQVEDSEDHVAAGEWSSEKHAAANMRVQAALARAELDALEAAKARLLAERDALEAAKARARAEEDNLQAAKARAKAVDTSARYRADGATERGGISEESSSTSDGSPGARRGGGLVEGRRREGGGSASGSPKASPAAGRRRSPGRGGARVHGAGLRSALAGGDALPAIEDWAEEWLRGPRSPAQRSPPSSPPRPRGGGDPRGSAESEAEARSAVRAAARQALVQLEEAERSRPRTERTPSPPPRALPPASASGRSQADLFDALDRNRDGVLTYKEIDEGYPAIVASGMFTDILGGEEQHRSTAVALQRFAERTGAPVSTAPVFHGAVQEPRCPMPPKRSDRGAAAVGMAPALQSTFQDAKAAVRSEDAAAAALAQQLADRAGTKQLMQEALLTCEDGYEEDDPITAVELEAELAWFLQRGPVPELWCERGILEAHRRACDEG